MSDGGKNKAIKNLLESSASLIKRAGNRTAQLARIAKLSSEINSAKDDIRTAQLELGKMYYETFRDDPHPQFADNCVRIKKSIDSVQEKKQLIEELKSGNIDKQEEDIFR
ncbi:MAG: hypothetical protein GX250_02530 [Clostridiales bacterium]|jgi:type I site-specific restriction endonuclease|nr:hypothetical protein [Clostridiales bacterium]